MIYSMTAFARRQTQQDSGTLICEIRSINHRYLEMSVHSPDALRSFEMAVRDRVRRALKRGKIECTLRLQSGHASAAAMPSINTNFAKELCGASETIASYLNNPAAVSVTDILRFPGVLEAQEVNQDELQKEVLELVDQTLTDLVASREREGSELNQLFLQRMELMGKELGKVRTKLPEVIKEQREKILQRFADVKLELDPSRLEQEMLLFSQKTDVAEEIERAETHINEFRRILKEGGVIGRRLDFLLQELNREANTLGSKSSNPLVTHAAVEMKVLIEQVREQVQNVE